MNQLPIIGITMGDPSGIGPEITVKVLSKNSLYEECRPIVIGDYSAMDRALKICGMEDKVSLSMIPGNFDDITAEEKRNYLESLTYGKQTIYLWDMQHAEIKDVPPGTLSGACGHAAFDYVRKVIELAMNKVVDATVTNPLNKEALHLGGHNFAGHTEIYAYYTNTKKYTMLLAHENIRVVHVSTHVSLREACDLVKKDRVLEVIKIADDACRKLGIEKPKVAVAGLNPHSGEGGLFGREEIDEITPAIEAAKKEGIDVDGPVPPDTLFTKVRGGWYDIAVAMYHDQGHIALKMDGFVYDRIKKKWSDVSGVNITLGLPIIRSSVDHGTAFDQAGKGIASEKSILNAIQYAIAMAKGK